MKTTLASVLSLIAGAAIAQPAAQPASQPKADVTAGPAKVDEQAEARKARLLADLKAIPTKRAGLGTAEHRKGLADTEAWLTGRLKELGLTPIVEEFVWNSPALKGLLEEECKAKGEDPAKLDESKFKFRNYVVEFRGTEASTEVVLIGAHYDAVPATPGADDNASGVVALLETARSLKDTKHQRTIRLVFFTLEEVGLVGSIEYVKKHKADWKPVPPPEGSPEDAKPTPPKETLVGMVSLECIGFFSDKPGSQVSPIPKIAGKPVIKLEIPDAGNFLGIGGISKHREFSQAFVEGMKKAEPSLPVVAADMLPIAPPDFMRSDHAPFLTGGQPAIILTDTANFRNQNYHKPTDTIDTLDLDRLAKSAAAVAGATSSLAKPVK